MASWLNITIKLQDKPASYIAEALVERVKGTLAAGTILGGKYTLRRTALQIAAILRAIGGGVKRGNVWVTAFSDSGAKPTGNIACVQANAAGNTVTFTYGTTTIVFTEGGTGAGGFARGASNTTCASNLAAAINAHPVLGGLVTALGAVGNCGLTGKVPTALLHNLTLTTDDATAFSFTQLNGGTPGVPSLFPQVLEGGQNP